MKILIACEFSQIVTKAFRNKGHEAFSCDIIPTEGNPDWHIQGDVLDILDDGWDMMIAHPPCTHLACSGAAWFEKKQVQQRQAIYFFMVLADSNIPKICIENPVCIMSTLWRPPDQIIQPYYFGDPYQKTTCLWLKNLPCLAHWEEDNLFFQKTHTNKGEFVIYPSGRKMPKWYAELRSHKNRAKERSRFWPGIANAMVEQWG